MIVREAITKYKKIGELNSAEVQTIDSPEASFRVVTLFMEQKELDPEKEHFFVLLLNRRNKLKGIEVVSTGTLTSSLVHSREVFRTAIRDGAAAIVVAHNHPTGNPNPSSADIQATRQLREAAKVIGIDLLDHVICGTKPESDDGSGYYSFNGAGLL